MLACIAAGASDAAIAATLGISRATAAAHVRDALARLGARNRRHAVAIVAGAQPGQGGVDDPLVVALASGLTVGEAAAASGLSLRTAHRRLAALRARHGAATTAVLVHRGSTPPAPPDDVYEEGATGSAARASNAATAEPTVGKT